MGPGALLPRGTGRIAVLPASPLLPPHWQLMPVGPRRHFIGTSSLLPERSIINCFVFMFIDSERCRCACTWPGVQGMSWLCLAATLLR